MQSRQYSGRCPAPNELGLPGMDPVFFTGEGHHLRLPAWYPAWRMDEHLLQELLHAPLDLTAHARRILLWNERALGAIEHQAQLAAALVDLFLVLDGKGLALRQRLLDQVGAQLPAGLCTQLQSSLRHGHLDTRALPDLPDSLFMHLPAYPRLPGEAQGE